MKQKRWRLFDKEKNIFFDELGFNQLKTIIENIKSGELQNWVVAEYGESQWQSVDEYIKTLPPSATSDRPMGHTTAQALPVMTVNAYRDELITTKTGFEISSPDKFNEQRKLKRLKIKIPVIVDFYDELLAGHTVDLSLVTIKLDKRFPIKYRGKTYELVLKTPVSFSLRCTPLITEKEVLRGQWNIMKIEPNLNFDKLKALLE